MTESEMGEKMSVRDVSYSVVIPVYNGGRSVGELTERLCRLFAKIGDTFEIVFVDDCSSDNSWFKLKEMAAADKRIKAIRLVRNFGQHNATLCGMFYAKGRYVITMDDDLQHAPEDIPLLMQTMKETGASVVIAKLVNKKHHWYRRRASDLMRKFNELIIKKPRGIYLSSYRLMDRSTVDKMLKEYVPFPYIPALLFHAANKVANAEILHYTRKYGDSNYTLKKMLLLAGRLVLNKFPMLRGLLGCSRQVFGIAEAENFDLRLSPDIKGGSSLETAGISSWGGTAAGSVNQKG